MNKEYFDALVKDRSDSADMLEKDSMCGIKNIVVDKYSEDAHFVYELLQNADDTKATYARFKLYHDRLVFVHNGTRRFSVSNPKTEGKDKECGCLGDVNAILSIGNSTKTDQNTIGKFGIGFKAVFQYTSTPYIYDPDIRFKIERFIVPALLENDHNERKTNETLFEFPFNSEKSTAETAFKEISDRLTSLINPILFLSNLKRITYEFDDTNGEYSKRISKKYTFDDSLCERITLTQKNDNNSHKQKLLLFSRNDENSGRYAVGYYLDDKSELTPTAGCAYCFFPTTTNTGLNFIIHAPFLLTDSRENIKKDNEHNKKMIDLLSQLAADSMVYLRDIGIQENKRLLDDNILNIIPTSTLNETGWFGSVVRKSEFEPFYKKIFNAFKTEKIIPTINGYTTFINAVWTDDKKIMKIFNNNAIKKMLNSPRIQWAFTSVSADNNKSEFIKNIVYKTLNTYNIINYIKPDFIEKCDIDWLPELYKWLDSDYHRKRQMKTLPIFISTEGKAVPAYDNEGKLILFLPTGEENDFTTISEKLLGNEDIREFVEYLGIKKPSLKNEIYNKILPIFDKGGNFYSGPYFKKLFEYFLYECPEAEKKQYINNLKKYDIIRYSTLGNKDSYSRAKPDTVYFPTDELKDYFAVKPSTRFVDWDGYLDLVGEENKECLESFLTKLGVHSNVIIKIYSLSNPYSKYHYNWSHSTGDEKYSESIIDGCNENITCIVNNHDSERAFYLWKVIVDIIRTHNHGIINYDFNKNKLDNYLWVRHDYFYYKDKEEWKNSSDITDLKYKKWLCDKNGNFVSPSETFVANLAKEYDTTSYAAKQFISFLGMPYEDPKLSRLTPDQRKDIELASLAKEYGIDSKDELAAILEEHKRKKAHPITEDKIETEHNTPSVPRSTSVRHSSDENTSKPKSQKQRAYIPEIEDDIDSDEYTPKTIDYRKKIERAKAKSEAEIDLIERMEELQQKAVDAERYSFGWFKALLELEMQESNENAGNSREVSISFGKVELEATSNRTLILKHPSSYIPRFMEELADIPLILEFENETKKLPIEVISIRSYTLRVKLKPNAEINDIHFNEVKEARIAAQNPVFLLEELKNQFTKLEFEDNYDMQQNLCSNIDFIFGPPGTGKTTYLANEIIIPIMKRSENCKVLVLTPTNKAADVITGKLQEIMGDDTSYKNWLIRFGSTDDETIDKSGIFKDKTFNINGFEKSVTVTTIDRFPYDFFMPDGEWHYLRNQKYDYIIFDEASMIPLIKIIYPLFYKKPRKFIIAGDPFQIEPVVHLDMWKGENIYKMIKLDSFAEPKTIPYAYNVKLLTEQYRSVPVIGELFSKMTYDGILKHHRNAIDQVYIDFGNTFEVKALNIIKFPVSKYESIYRAKRLNGKTPYHIYSALFAYEFTTWMAYIIAHHNPQKHIRIGVIAAYKAQADMIERLISSANIPDTITIQSGTIHGFQGDECEIIISVYNPPPSISAGKGMFLNKKNIINVSISRARDYLFVIMPDNDTENVDNLLLIKKMERFIKDSEEYTEYSSHDIEQLIFGTTDFLEENSFSTSHQNVNVYGLPEQIYEIRSEDNAIDIQIHKNPNIVSLQ